jgi:hypothetical protein
LEKPEAQAKLSVFQNMFSFDLRTQLHHCRSVDVAVDDRWQPDEG